MSGDATFTFPNGVTVGLQPIPIMTFQLIAADTTGKPQVPVVTSVIRGQSVKERNPDDPAYIAALTAWESAHNTRLLRLCILKGIADSPPDEDAQRIADEYGVTTAADIKCLWVSEMLPDEQSIARFSEAVLSQTVITKAGLEHAAESFRGKD